MNGVKFRNWLINKGIKIKVVGDTISRLKRIGREIENCDIIRQYRSDFIKYSSLVFAFAIVLMPKTSGVLIKSASVSYIMDATVTAALVLETVMLVNIVYDSWFNPKCDIAIPVKIAYLALAIMMINYCAVIIFHPTPNYVIAASLIFLINIYFAYEEYER